LMKRILAIGNACSSRDKSESRPVVGLKKANASQSTSPNATLLSISASFKFHDLKADGVIDREELLSYFKSDKTVGAILERLDKNKDGVISYAEFYSEVSKIRDGEATLQRYLEKFPLSMDAVSVPADKPSKTLRLLNCDIPMTWASYVDEALVEKVLKHGPFIDWVANINLIENHDATKPELIVDKVHIQHIDMFGPRVGFVKFEVAARKWNEKVGQVAFVPGVVFMRGGAVGILCILIEAETGKEYAVVTLQPRIPAGFTDFPELPAGMECNLRRLAIS